MRRRDFIPGLAKAAAEAFAQSLVDMFAEVGQGIYKAEPRTPETTTPTSFGQWCDEVLRPAVGGLS